MNLDGRFAGPEFGGNLFIQQALCDKRHDFAFPWGQLLIVLPQSGYFRVLLAARAIPIDSFVNRVEQFLIAEGLGEEVDGSGLHRLYGNRDVAVAGDEDDRDVEAGGVHLTLEFEPAHTGQPHVENEATGIIDGSSSEEVRTGDERFNAHPDGFQQILDSVADRGIIVDDKNDWMELTHAFSPVGRVN